MCGISNKDGLFGYGSSPWQNGNSAKTHELQIIKQAASISLIHVFRHYGVHLNESNKKIICPFKFHNNGKERSPSFYYYPQTNSFWCFGCKTGTSAVDFVSCMDNIDKVQAANKILNLFSSEINEEFFEKENFAEKFEHLMKFSTAVFDFRNKFSDEKSFQFIEKICQTFDSLNLKHELNNNALTFIIKQLIEKINNYG